MMHVSFVYTFMSDTILSDCYSEDRKKCHKLLAGRSNLYCHTNDVMDLYKKIGNITFRATLIILIKKTISMQLYLCTSIEMQI